MSLNAAYTQAEKVRDAERHRLARDDRQDMVRVLSSEGMSTRAMGAVLGVHHTTAGDDLRAIRASGGNPPVDAAPVTVAQVFSH